MFLRSDKETDYGVTPVENLFITEYLPQSKGDYVKIYLYVLYAAHNGKQDIQTEDLAALFGLQVTEVESGLRYWERRRLLEKNRDGTYRLHSPLYLAKEAGGSMEVDMAFVAFSEDVYALFGDKRKVRASEVAQAYEWVVDMGLPQETVLMLISHAITTRGAQFSFKALEAEAARMKSMNIITAEEAEAYFTQSRLVQEGARAVLRRLGRRRNPSQDETDLYAKWTGEWHYTPDAVLEACRETTKGEPTFAYLDGILRGMRERAGASGTVSAVKAREQLEEEKAKSLEFRRFASALGVRNPPDTLRSIYQRLTAQSGEELVLLAAEEAGRNGQGIEGVEKMLSYFERNNLSTPEKARDHLQKIRGDNQILLGLYSLMGIRSAPTARDRALLNKWQEWQLDEKALEMAAALSQHKTQPMAYMDQILQSWHTDGMPAPQDVRSAAAKKRQLPRENTATVSAQRYAQREYDQEQLDALADEVLQEARKNHE